jgi:hypothetical protein
MSYIVQRKDRFYVVAYDGLDPLSGKERRRWHPVGHDRDEAEAVRRRLELEPRDQQPPTGGPITFSTFLHETWMPRKRRQVRATTAYRYAWFIKHYITPAIGDIPLRRLRVDHLESLYQQLAVTGGRHQDGLAPKTILEVHMIVRAALGLATERQLVVRNVATSAQLKVARAGGPIARSWTASELATFLATHGGENGKATSELGGEMKETILFDHARCSCPTPSQRSKQLRSSARIALFRVQCKNALCRGGVDGTGKREGRRRRRHEEAQECRGFGKKAAESGGERRCE